MESVAWIFLLGGILVLIDAVIEQIRERNRKCDWCGKLPVVKTRNGAKICAGCKSALRAIVEGED
jgi:hypothetical protein